MPLQVAINYDAGWYSTGGPRLMGANAASEGFLRALTQYPGLSQLGACVETKKSLDALAEKLRQWNPNLKLHGFHPQALQNQQYDLLYQADPSIAPYAWYRRAYNPAGWSLCGVTHTTCSLSVLGTLRDLLLTPFEPWDALICTSHSVLQTVHKVVADYGEYLHTLGQGGTFRPKLQLPVVPLGVDYETLSREGTSPLNRKTQRAALGIPAEAVVFLFLGRLVYHCKAHPLPMFLALQRTAEATGKEIHLIMAGWFGSPDIEKVFRASAGICPKVKVHFVDGRRPEIRQQIWAASDVFISLVDNIQETFGLTPLEAMAAKLPVIVSDWNGYRETVRHDVDGFLIPTYAPASGGLEWVQNYQASAVTYDEYVAGICQSTAVDVDATTAACIQMVENPQLRQQMGLAGQQRVEQHFAWRHIIGKYFDLWNELRTRRLAASPAKNSMRSLPWVNDPFVAYGHYPTSHLTPEIVIQLTTDGKRLVENPQLLQQLYAHRLLRFVGKPGLLLEPNELEALLRHLAPGPRPAGDLLPVGSQSLTERTWRTLGWLIKCDMLKVVNKPPVRGSEYLRYD